MLFLPYIDNVFHVWEAFAFQVAPLAGSQFGEHLISHLHEIAVFLAVDNAQGMHIRVLAEVFQFGLFIVGIYGNVDGSYLGTGI